MSDNRPPNACAVLLRARDYAERFHPRRCTRPVVEGENVCKLHLTLRENRRARHEAAFLADRIAQRSRNA